MDWVWSWISVDSATASSRGLGQDGAAAGQRPDMGSGQTSRRGLLTPVLLATAVVGAWGVRESFATSNTPEGRGRLVGSELPVGDDGVHDQHCSLDPTHCEFFPVRPFPPAPEPSMFLTLRFSSCLILRNRYFQRTIVKVGSVGSHPLIALALPCFNLELYWQPE